MVFHLPCSRHLKSWQLCRYQLPYEQGKLFFFFLQLLFPHTQLICLLMKAQCIHCRENREVLILIIFCQLLIVYSSKHSGKHPLRMVLKTRAYFPLTSMQRLIPAFSQPLSQILKDTHSPTDRSNSLLCWHLVPKFGNLCCHLVNKISNIVQEFRKAPSYWVLM